MNLTHKSVRQESELVPLVGIESQSQPELSSAND
jgi:hypothetical protein